MKVIFRYVGLFLILLSFVFFGYGFIVSYEENKDTFEFIKKDSNVNISTVNGEGAYGLTSSADTNDGIKNNNDSLSNKDEHKNIEIDSVIDSSDINNVLRIQLQNEYGISIKYGSETDGYTIDTLTTVGLSDINSIHNALLDMQNTISLFPKDLFWEIKNAGYPLTIYLINNYSSENITGITESYSNRVNISIAMKFSFAETFNHEIYHYLENFITKFRSASYNNWNTLNLSDFSYGSVRSDLSYNRTYSENSYFVNNYAQSSANEDRASTFEYMMFENKSSCLNMNKPVWKKAKFISDKLDRYLESVKPDVVEYWERHL